MISLKNNKPLRSAIIGVIVLGLLVGAYFLVMNMSGGENPQTPDEPIETKSIEIFKTTIDDIKEIFIKNPSNTFTVTKIGDDWGIKETQGIEYSPEKINSYVYDFVLIYAEKEMENVDDLAQYGLDAPQAVVEIRLKDGTSNVFELGSAAIGGSGYFLKNTADGKVYTIATYKAESILQKTNYFRNTTLAAIDIKTISGFKLVKSGVLTADIRAIEDSEKQKFPQTATFLMTQPRYGAVAADVFKLKEEGLRVVVTEFIEDNPQNLAKYGLANPSAVVTITDANGTYKISYGDKTEDGNLIYAMLGGKNFVFTQPTTLYDNVTSFETDALLYKFAHLIDIKNVNTVVIEGDGKKHTLKITGEGDNAAYYIDGKDAVGTSFKKAYQAVIGLVGSGFAESKPSGAPQWTITFNYKDGSVLKTDYINYDDRNYIVSGEKGAEIIILKKNLSAMMSVLDEFAANPLKEIE